MLYLKDQVFTINGNEIDCLVSFTFSESLEAVETVQGLQLWAKYAGNLQGYSITLSGIEEGAWNYLRNFKRGFTLVDWQIVGINYDGQAFITSLDRTSPSDQDTTFSATLTGFGPVGGFVPENNRILEDGDLRLLEDGDNRFLESA